MYIAITARPDIAFSLNKTAQFMDNPGMKHWEAVINIMTYLRTFPDLAIEYKNLSNNRPNTLYAYCDSDYAGDQDERKSTSFYVSYMNGGDKDLYNFTSNYHGPLGEASPLLAYQHLHTNMDAQLAWHHLKRPLTLNYGPLFTHSPR